MNHQSRLRIAIAILLWAPFFTSVAQAVRPGEVSWTAQVVCYYRALAAQHPDPKLRNPDYLAGKFLTESFWDTAHLGRDYETARMTMKIYGAAAYYYVNARTHHVDTLLKKMADAGAKQVVILGAGFDSRGYRFQKIYPQLRFFEVDLPATIESKKEKVIQLFGGLPDSVVYAPIDFNTQRLEDVLKSMGYHAGQKSYFIWEGVTPYITEAACRETLSFIKNHAGAGSTVVFDYILRPIIEGKYDGFYGGAQSNAETVAARGEPYVCGWTAREASDMVQEIGLEIVSDVDTDFLTEQYLIDSNGQADGIMGNFYRIMYARVP